MASSLFADINELEYTDLLRRMENYSKQNKMEIFMFQLPKSDLEQSSFMHEKCFIIMSVGYKIALVNGGVNESEYEEYCDDVREIIRYLYSKFEYRKELGRYSKWDKSLICDDYQLADLQNLDKFWNSLKAENRQEIRYTELLVTLCIGSINDINRVKAEVPGTILDQVKQKIQAFDADQTRFIYQELNQPLVKIQGLSGTGKTELLLHKLKELYQKPEKYKIFVTCHNKILADSLCERIPKFFNFMKVSQQIEWNNRLWCTNAWGSQNIANSGFYKYITDFYEINFYPFRFVSSFESACDIAVKEIKKKYKDAEIPKAVDYVIVDECQDFKESFFELCKLVTAKKVYIAGDVFQSIFEENNEKNYSADYFLSKCYRTDSRTLMFAHALGLGLFEQHRLRWLKKEDWEACGYNYKENVEKDSIVLKREPVRRFLDIDDNYESLSLVPFESEKLYETLHKQINKILNENPTATVNDICIIFLDSGSEIYKMANILEALVMDWFDWIVNKAYETKRIIPNTLLLSNRNNIKGLEYTFVICVTKHLTFNYAYRNAIYTMLTRSFLQTILLLPQIDSGISKPIIDGYNEIMKERQMTIKIPSEQEREEIETRFQSVKRQKPISEILNDIIAQMELNNEDKNRLYAAAMKFGWDSLSDEEIKEKVNTLKGLL